MALPEAVLLDTSVLLRLFHDHEDPPQESADLLGEAFLRGEIQLILLDLSVYEFVNILVRRPGKGAAEAERLVGALFGLGMPLVGVDRSLASAAGRISASTGLSGYDGAFVAAGSLLGVPLVTADRRIVELAGTFGAVHLEDLRR